MIYWDISPEEIAQAERYLNMRRSAMTELSNTLQVLTLKRWVLSLSLEEQLASRWKGIVVGGRTPEEVRRLVRLWRKEEGDEVRRKAGEALVVLEETDLRHRERFTDAWADQIDREMTGFPPTLGGELTRLSDDLGRAWREFGRAFLADVERVAYVLAKILNGAKAKSDKTRRRQAQELTEANSGNPPGRQYTIAEEANDEDGDLATGCADDNGPLSKVPPGVLRNALKGWRERG